MDTLYSSALLVSLAAGALAAFLSLLMPLSARVPRIATALGSKSKRLLYLLVGIAFAALLTSLLVHFFWGHRPGSAEALGPIDFISNHPSFLIAGALPLMALAIYRLPFSDRKSGSQSDDGS